MRWISSLMMGICVLVMNAAHAQQNLYQTIKGSVLDGESKKPIAGATIQLLNTARSTTSDSTGHFSMVQVAVGRQSLLITSVGFETKTISEIMVSSGKEVEVTVLMTEKIQQLSTVLVSSKRSRLRPLNEMATVSARSFSVEDTRRYAAAAFDPARMAQNFAGVSNNGDGSNEIVIRGNSPKGILWRLEGIEIPNPNHFSALGATGGAVSMLSSSTLSNSDFYTGAFPAEFGNATSGVFDLNFRAGNNTKREHSFMIGGMGLEAATEGYFKKGSSSSYLVNYRYSTLALMKSFLKSLNGIVPDYQDLSFKLNFPTAHAGTFSVFGLGGINIASKDPVKDSTKWEDEEPNFIIREKRKTGVVGLSHQIFLNKHAYLKTILAASGSTGNGAVDSINAADDYSIHLVARNAIGDGAWRASVLYNNKINSRSTFRAGAVASHLTYNYNSLWYDGTDKVWRKVLNGKGGAQYYQGYAQWKYRISNRLTVNTGLHSSYFALNNTYSLEPRGAVTYSAPGSQTFTLAAGIHARPEHLSTYLLDFNNKGVTGIYPNKNLELTKASHFILGYDKGLKGGWHLKGEAYYQHLYDVPVEKKQDSYFSILNASNIDDLMHLDTLISAGRGNNYGLDVTVEKPFQKNYYMMLTTSLYHSTYTNFSGQHFNSLYDRRYQVNLVAGKEWKNSRNRIWGVNAKLLNSGGLKQSPIDVEASRSSGKVVYVQNEYYTLTQPAYYRLDAGVSYKINKRGITHTIMFDVQNITNHQNLYMSYYDRRSESVKSAYQMGFFPIVNYRVEL